MYLRVGERKTQRDGQTETEEYREKGETETERQTDRQIQTKSLKTRMGLSLSHTDKYQDI